MDYRFSNKVLANMLMLLGAVMISVCSFTSAQAAVMTIVNTDGPGEGFNDTTPFTPVGGNHATTLGQARLNAFQNAADSIGKLLTSAVPIRVNAQMNPLGGSALGTVLGRAGPAGLHRNFPGAPAQNRWYPAALANKLSGADLNPAKDEINAQFNSSVDGTVILGARKWYYGFDGLPPANDIDFVTVVLHELIHGLGFTSGVDLATGAKLGAPNAPFDDAFMVHLEHHGAMPSGYPAMTNAQRVTASMAFPNLHWIGARTVAANGGRHVSMYAPNPQQPGSSVSHFDEKLFKFELMSPVANGVQHAIGLAGNVLTDIGWGALLTQAKASHDFNGDSKSDILFHQASTGRNFVMLMNGRSLLSQGFVRRLVKTWSVAGVGDFNADGKADILFHQASTGRNFIMLMNGRAIISMGFVRRLSKTWSVAGVGDFNADGKADILFHQASTGRNFIMLMNGRAIISMGFVRRLSKTWSVAGVGDFNADGKADILFHQASTGRNFMMFMNGRAVLSQGFVRRLLSSWSVAGIGDFNADGKADILFHQASTGRNFMMLMNGRAVLSLGSVRSLTKNWAVADVGDFNGDGKTDILFHQASTGRNFMMLMNGRAVLSQGFVRRLGTSWRIVKTQ